MAMLRLAYRVMVLVEADEPSTREFVDAFRATGGAFIMWRRDARLGGRSTERRAERRLYRGSMKAVQGDVVFTMAGSVPAVRLCQFLTLTP